MLPFRRVLPFYSRTPLAQVLGVDVSLHVVGSTYEIQKQTWVRERKIALSKKYLYVWLGSQRNTIDYHVSCPAISGTRSRDRGTM